MATGKDTSKPFIFNDSPLTEVNTSGSDDNSMKLKSLIDVHLSWLQSRSATDDYKKTTTKMHRKTCNTLKT